ncbi:hypothetical protein GGI06_003083 [Coemansia sp. S85]|nr:hypothetical protein GGI06_003083 [Coemansia sp. S85]
MTPHAPCTNTWMKKAPASSWPNLLGRIHSGMKHAPQIAHMAMVLRRPRYSEMYPKNMPPTMAPRLPTMVPTVACLGEKPCCFFRNVGYKSWLPCERKFMAAISTMA